MDELLKNEKFLMILKPYLKSKLEYLEYSFSYDKYFSIVDILYINYHPKVEPFKFDSYISVGFSFETIDWCNGKYGKHFSDDGINTYTINSIKDIIREYKINEII